MLRTGGRHVRCTETARRRRAAPICRGVPGDHTSAIECGDGLLPAAAKIGARPGRHDRRWMPLAVELDESVPVARPH
jgi:hypothetical protein